MVFIRHNGVLSTISPGSLVIHLSQFPHSSAEPFSEAGRVSELIVSPFSRRQAQRQGCHQPGVRQAVDADSFSAGPPAGTISRHKLFITLDASGDNKHSLRQSPQFARRQQIHTSRITNNS
jgi:hypothetical protein